MATRRAEDVEVASGLGSGSGLGSTLRAAVAAASSEGFPVAPEGTRVYSAADDDQDSKDENNGKGDRAAGSPINIPDYSQ